jgi:hypothetical protein
MRRPRSRARASGTPTVIDRETIVSGAPAHAMSLSAHEQETQSYD